MLRACEPPTATPVWILVDESLQGIEQAWCVLDLVDQDWRREALEEKPRIIECQIPNTEVVERDVPSLSARRAREMTQHRCLAHLPRPGDQYHRVCTTGIFDRRLQVARNIHSTILRYHAVFVELIALPRKIAWVRYH